VLALASAEMLKAVTAAATAAAAVASLGAAPAPRATNELSFSSTMQVGLRYNRESAHVEEEKGVK